MTTLDSDKHDKELELPLDEQLALIKARVTLLEERLINMKIRTAKEHIQYLCNQGIPQHDAEIDASWLRLI